MRLKVTEDRAAIEAARAAAVATERRLIEEVFGKIDAQATADQNDPVARHPWFWINDSERGALRRNRTVAVPRLVAIADGRKGESETVRLFAAVVLQRVDPVDGFRALLSLIGCREAAVLADLLDELESILDEAPELPAQRTLALDEANIRHIVGLLDHPDPKVAHKVVAVLGASSSAEAMERLRRRAQDPALGNAIRLELARDGQSRNILETAIAALAAPGDDVPNPDDLKLVEQFARDNPVPEVAALARTALKSLEQSPRLAEDGRSRLASTLKWLEYRDGVEARRASDLEKGSAVIERLRTAGFIDRNEADQAIAALGRSEWGNAGDDPAWGLREGFAAAGLRLNFHQECSSESPPPHHELIHDLAATSRGTFAPEAVSQHPDPSDPDTEDDYPVEFVHRGRLYSATVRSQRGWYDSKVIVGAANVALADAGEPRRFVIVDDDEFMTLVFVDPERLRAIAPEIGLRPEAIADPDAAAADALGDPSSRRVRTELRELLDKVSPDLTDAEFARAAGDRGRTALHRAAVFDRTDLIEALLVHGADVDATDDYGKTALHAAAGAGSVRSMKVLMAAGADISAPDSSRWTPLHVAAGSNQPGAITLLVKHGAILRARDHRGFTPLHSAANDGAPAAAALLIECGIDVDVRIRKTEPTEDTPTKKGLPLYEILAWSGWHLGGKFEEGQTPLHRAAHRGRRNVAEVLLARKADVNAVDSRLQTPLHVAIANDRADVAELLRSHGANPDLRDDQGRTPAERAGDRQVEDLKMQRGLYRLAWILRLASGVIRVFQVVTYPIRLAARVVQRIARP